MDIVPACKQNRPCIIGNINPLIPPRDVSEITYCSAGSFGNGGRNTLLLGSSQFAIANLEADPGSIFQNFEFEIVTAPGNDFAQIKYLGTKTRFIRIEASIVLRPLSGTHTLLFNATVSPGGPQPPYEFDTKADLIAQTAYKYLALDMLIQVPANSFINLLLATTTPTAILCNVLSWTIDVTEITFIVK